MPVCSGLLWTYGEACSSLEGTHLCVTCVDVVHCKKNGFMSIPFQDNQKHTFGECVKIRVKILGHISPVEQTITTTITR